MVLAQQMEIVYAELVFTDKVVINVHHSTQHLFKHNQHSQLSPHSQPGNRSQLSHFSRLSIHFKQLHQSVKFAHPTTAMAMEHAYQSTLAHT